ncbi:MAG: ADOP family duplicated permease [Acidobacteriota bacterium]
MGSSWWTDLRLALRQWRKRPAPIAAALTVLAIGIGANAAVFSIAHALLLRPLPYVEPDRLVRLAPERPVSRHMLDVFRTDGRGFVDVSAYDSDRVALTGDGEPETLFAMSVSAHHFELLGIRPVHGRSFRDEASSPGRGDSVLLTHELWRTRFAADPEVVGRTIEIDDRPREILGVLPATFRPLRRDVGLYLPLEIDPSNDDYDGMRFLSLVARLDGEHDLQHARAETRRLFAQIRADDPSMLLEDEVRAVNAVGLHEAESGEARGAVVVLAAVTALILLAACANVANLLLAQAVGRQREMAVRAALGAGTRRLVRQLLVESLLLGLAGGALGLALAKIGLVTLTRSLADTAPELADAGLSTMVLGLSVALSLVAAMIFGSAPALRLARVDLRGALQAASRGSTGRQWLGQALVAAQVAASMVLLVGAGLFLRSLSNLHAVELGFATEHRLTAQIVPSAARYADEESQRLLWQRMLDTLEAQPWSEQVGAAQALPLTGSRWIFPIDRHDRAPAADGGQTAVARVAIVNDGFFDTLEIPLLAGRGFDAGDGADAERAAIVDQAYARTTFGGENPLGRLLRVDGEEGDNLRIVGVVADVRHDGPSQASPGMVYLPLRQWPQRVLNVAIRTTADDPGAAASATRWADELRAAVWSIDPDAPVSALRAYDDIRAENTVAARMLARLVGLFAAVALALAAAGLYGVLAQLVAARRRELGIRLALGARRRTVELDVVGRSARLVLAGLALGTVGAWALGRLAASQLHEVSATEPVAWLGAAVLLTLLALAGAWLPARRAGRVDPATVLRAD